MIGLSYRFPTSDRRFRGVGSSQDTIGGSGSSSSLLSGLSAYWSANLTDGVDVISGNTVNVLGGNAENQPGKIGNCWSPLVGGAVIDRNLDVSNINFAGSFTLACWFKCEISPSIGLGILRIPSTGSPARGYFISFQAGPIFRFSIGDGSVYLPLNGPSIAVDSLWHRVVAYYDSVNSVMGIYKDNDSPFEGSTEGFVYAAPLVTDDFRLAQLDWNTSLKTQIDEIGMWNRRWSSAENLEHWNGGNGKAYPFI